MQDDGQAYVQIIRDRLSSLEQALPEDFRATDATVTIVDKGYGVRARPSLTEPELQVGEGFARAGEYVSREGVTDIRDVLAAIIACEINRAHTANEAARRVEQAGRWFSTVLRIAALMLGVGLVAGSAWLTFSGGIAVIVSAYGLRLRLAGIRAHRERIYRADATAADWVGRQAVVDGLQWWWRVRPAEPQPRLAAFALPTVQDRLAALGARPLASPQTSLP
uniref:hypothetical protein n=1 Tax=Nonomuraea sp. CA-251285 TaxID=3240002 RepID=UPI003F490B44